MTVSGRRRVQRRVATVLTELTGPPVCASAAVLAVAAADQERRASAIWGGVTVTLVAAVPFASLVVGARAGRWTDRHVADRRVRALPLSIALACVALAIVLLITVDAPRSLLALVAAMLAGLVAMLTITHWWKVSIHMAVAAGLTVVLAGLVGWWAVLAVPVLAAVGWARVVLGAHTRAQAVAGAICGGFSALLFPLLR